jgi:hypothetical protein
VREISLCRFRVDKASGFLAAKRRKNTARGVSRGFKWEMIQPQRGERGVFTHTLQPPWVVLLDSEAKSPGAKPGLFMKEILLP